MVHFFYSYMTLHTLYGFFFACVFTHTVKGSTNVHVDLFLKRMHKIIYFFTGYFGVGSFVGSH